MSYKYAGVDHFYRETVELTRKIMRENEQINSWQMHKFKSEKKLSENAEAFLKKLCADFMSYEFDGIDFPEINFSLLNRTDDVYNDWVEFAKSKGLNNLELVQAGWEMIFGGEFSYVPAMQKFY